MPYYVICGKPDCPKFVHAIQVAQYLNKQLPRFDYKKIEKNSYEWRSYVCLLNQENKWFVTESPLIWKEINMWGGKKYLIGGLSEFWEYVYCYYGLESLIPKSEMMKLAADNLKFFEARQSAEVQMHKRQEEERMVISICGVVPQTPLLIFELLQLECLQKQQNILVKLFDTLGRRDTSRSRIFDECDFEEDLSANVIVAANIAETLNQCNILIYMYDLSKKEMETNYEWLSRVLFRMQIFADNLHEHGRRDLKVILNGLGPSCFMASILLEYCTKLRPYNIVVVTSNEGLSMLNVVSEKTGVKVEQMGAPPVWGFTGINSFVDEKYIVSKATMLRPFKRSLTAPRGSTLPLGTTKTELRLLTYLLTDVDHNELVQLIEQRREKAKQLLGYEMGLSKVRAVVSLLKEWYSDGDSGNIISLGIYSDGSFGLPSGVVFSQPVKLDETGKWVPYSKFPLMNDNTRDQINKLANEAQTICEKFITPSVHVDVQSDSETREEDVNWLLNQTTDKCDENE